MSPELMEHEVQDPQDVESKETQDSLEDNYMHYIELGGIINEKDFQNALARSKQTTSLNKAAIAQSEVIAHRSGIELHNSNDSLDPRTVLYGVLRSDTAPTTAKEGKYHHSQMSDQRLFAEALRMLGDTDSLEKLIAAHPHISFN